MAKNEKICIALDVDNAADAIELVKKLQQCVGLFKIGSQLFTTEGPSIVNQVTALGSKVFLDLKFHDIPNTVKNAAIAAVRLGVSMINVHTIGGFEMMDVTSSAINREASSLGIPKPLVLGVTVLTSTDSSALASDMKVSVALEDYVVHLARLAKRAGLDGVVASPLEIDLIRRACGPDFTILTPGVRPSWASNKNDQKRVMAPGEAIRKGADFIVVGRPVIKATDPVEAARRLCEELPG